MKNLLLLITTLLLSTSVYSQIKEVTEKGDTINVIKNEPLTVFSQKQNVKVDVNQNNKKIEGKLNTIKIGNYKFLFPVTFELKEFQGTDSYVGQIIDSDIILNFDYGWYTSPASNLDENKYIINEDEVNGHFRQIVKPLNSDLNRTSIHLYKISDKKDSPFGFSSLSMSTNKLDKTQQEMIIEVFKNVVILGSKTSKIHLISH